MSRYSSVPGFEVKVKVTVIGAAHTCCDIQRCIFCDQCVICQGHHHECRDAEVQQ